MPQKLMTFLRSARGQATDLRREFAATLILSRRRQLAVVSVLALVPALTVLVTVRGARHAHATWSTCPTVIPASTPGTPGGDTVVPAGWRIVALPRDVIAPDVRPGDLVDLVSQSRTVASSAVVVTGASETAGINVAVSPDAAPLVATAAQNGDVSVLALG